MKTDLILQRSTFSTNSSSTILKRLSTGSISLVRKTIFLVCIGLFGFNSWGQIAQRGSATTATSTTTSVTVDKPTGLIVGDVLIATINQADNDNNSLSNAILTGWQLVGGAKFYTSGDNEWWGTVLYKVATATDANASNFTFQGNSEADDIQASIIAFSGVDQTNPIDIAGTYTSNSTNNTSLTASTISTTTNNAAVIMLAMISDNRDFNSDWSSTSPTSLTELFDLPFDADLDMGIGGAWVNKPSAGATGNGSVTLSGNARDGAILLALKPYIPGGTYTTTFTSNGTYTVPSCVSSLTVQTWGAGGAGGGVTEDVRAGGGGEGGSYVSGTLSVTAGATCNITVGTGGAGGTGNGENGGFSRFEIGTTTHFNAIGGAGGAGGTNSNNFGTGGNSTNSGNIVSGSSQVTFYGGNGGTATNSNFATSGGGGGSAGQGGNGGNGGALTSGAAGSNGGIAGAIGRGSANDGDGINGGIPGAGGSGARNANNNDNYNGGNGGNGLVRVTYTLPNNPTITLTNTTVSACFSASAQDVTLAYSTTTGCADKYSIDFASGITDITEANLSGSSILFSLPAGLATGTYTGTLTVKNNTYSFLSGTYSISVTITQPTTAITIGNATIGDGDYLWNGNINSNGNVKDNWFVLNSGVYSIPNQVPQATHEVFVIKATAGSCISTDLTVPVAGSFSAQNIHIGPDANVTFGNNASFEVRGNFVNNGTFTAGSGTVIMNGSTAQTIGGLAATTFNNLTINNTAGVSLNKAIDVNGSLNLSNGVLSIGNNNLTIGTSGSIVVTSPSSSKMINTSGTGELRKQFSAGTYNPASFTFPVGTSNGTNKYNPVILDFVSGTFGASAYVGVRVQDQKNPLLHSDNTTYINKTWIVEPNNEVTEYKYNIKLYFNPAAIAQGGDFVSTSGQTIGELIPVKYSEGQWYQPIDGSFSGAFAQGFAGALVSNHLVWDSLTTFSEFGGVGSSNNPLPVELLSFNGTCNEGMVNLQWQTASEFNSSHFDVEKSSDGETWRVLATIPSAGTSNELLTYQAVDNNGTNGANYYRLRQVDIDGKEKLYDPINVSCVKTTAGYFTSYPNPSGNEFQVVVNNKEILGACTLNIVDVHGKVIDQRSIDMKDGINLFVINETLNPGIYFLNITNGIKSTQVIKHAVK
jgi:hypothetical protein